MTRFAPNLRTLGWVLAALLLAMAVLPLAADARPSRKKAIWGPVTVNGASQFPIYAELGAGIYHTRLVWANIAQTKPANPRDPADPAYVWPAEMDMALAEARKYGMQIAVEVSWSPGWANGGKPGNYAPKRARDFADFVRAAATRYRGVKYWVIWSEPTRRSRYQPLIAQSGPLEPLTRKQRRAPRRYAQMLDAAYGALKSVSRTNMVVGGNTWTGGDISPKFWIQYLEMPNGRPPRMDFYGHNPFARRRPRLSRPPAFTGFYDICDLDDLAPIVDRYLGRGPSGKKLKFFLGEYFIPTDHSNHEFNWWVSQRLAASWLRDALKLVRGYSRVETLAWLSLYDDPPRPDGEEVNRGLLTFDGKRKPAFEAFKDG